MPEALLSTILTSPTISDDRFHAEIIGRTAELAEIISGDIERPVPTCPGWTFKQLATHLGRGHRWAAQIVATRATTFISPRDVPDGKLPADQALYAEWLNRGAALVVEAVTAAGAERVWTFVGTRPAGFWARRRAHEAAVHLADVQLATGRDTGLPADFAADGVDEWLEILAASDASATETAVARSAGLRGDGQTLHFHATDEGLGGAGEWMVRRTPSGITVERGHGKADVAVRGPAVKLLLVLMRRLPASATGIEVYGEGALLAHWLEHTQF
jgi:uncharacterized protein (TIGR03083 family)